MSKSMSGLSPAGRDAALRRMRVFNRVLAGTAIAFTGVLADVAAQAFPGHSRSTSAATSSHIGVKSFFILPLLLEQTKGDLRTYI